MSKTSLDPLDNDLILGHEHLRRMMARQAIQSGLIPGCRPDSTRDLQGNGANCTICVLPISPQEPGYQLEFTQAGRRQATHYLHVPCFAAWEFECRKPNDEAPPGIGRLNGQTRGPVR